MYGLLGSLFALALSLARVRWLHLDLLPGGGGGGGGGT